MRISRRATLALACFGLLVAFGLVFGGARPALLRQSVSNGPPRIVSLSPGVTETLFELGVGARVVGISDYCISPKAQSLPRVGSALTPQYEKIAALNPSLIVTSSVGGEQLAPLSRLAKTASLPWLTLDEWKSSVLALGELVSAKEQAGELEDRISAAFKSTVAPDAPRVLLALDYGSIGSKDIWFIKKNSIHGSLLEASGGRNAVDRDFPGEPKLSVEQILKLDPDGILVLLPNGASAHAAEKSRAAFLALSPLSAAKEGRVAVLSHQNALTIGPSLLTLIPAMKQALDRLFSSEGRP